MQIGLRDANQQFSRLMKAVRRGQEVVLTDRGKPLAVVKPIPNVEEAEAVVHRLEAAGVLRPASKRGTLPAWSPRKLRRVPLSKTVHEERDER